MPETSGENVGCGRHQQDKTPLGPPSSDVVSPPAAGSQCWSSVGATKPKQQRPSVLRQVTHTASRRRPETSVAVSVCQEEVGARCLHQSSSPQTGSQLLSLTSNGAKHSLIEARLHDSVPEGMSVLFMSGLCRWPGCDAVLKDFPNFLKHLHSDHCHGDRSIAQWRVQQDIVQRMENQLIVEKQKLVAMQLHLHLFEHTHSAQPTDGDRVQHMEKLSQHCYRATGPAHLLTDLVSSVEYYKYNNMRPPYTYAYLIRWSILESPDKQRTLNEIYNWFTTMFFYFRHNTATWKNAVRHNLSLHKCFVRVEGGKGAVWTVDEAEYQRRKGQKYHRDCPVKWLTSYPHFCPEEP